MLFKSTWFVFTVAVLVVSIDAAPNGYKENNVRRHESKSIALPAFKRQDRPWRNETEASLPATITRKASPVPLSYSSAIEQSQSTSVSKSDTTWSVIVGPTRSLSSSPEGSPSESIGPITLKRTDVASASMSSLSTRIDISTTFVATGLSNTHVPTSQQEASISQTPEAAASSSQIISVSSSKVKLASESSIVQSVSASSPQFSASEQSSTSHATISRAPALASPPSSPVSSVLVQSSAVESLQKASTPIAPSFKVEQPPTSSIVPSQQGSSNPTSTQGKALQSITPSPEIVQFTSINTPSSAPSSIASRSDASVSDSSSLSPTPVSPASNSQIVLSGVETRFGASTLTSSVPPATPISQPSSTQVATSSSWVSSTTSHLIPLSLSTATSLGVESSQGLSSVISLVSSGPTPTASSVAVLPGVSPGLSSSSSSSSSLTVLTYTISTISSTNTLSFVSSSAIATSNTAANALSSSTPSRQESSAYFTSTETWTQPASSLVSATSLVPPPASTGIMNLNSSATQSASTSVTSFNTGVTLASESSNPPSSSLSLSSVSMSSHVALSGITSSIVASTTLLNGPSDLASSSTVTPTVRQSWTSLTLLTNLAPLNSSTYVSPFTGSSVAVIGTTSLPQFGSASSLSSAIPRLSTTSVSQHESSATPAAVPSPSIAINGTSVFLPQVPSESAKWSQGWNVSSTFNAAESRHTIKSASLPTGMIFSSIGSHREAVQTSTTFGSSKTIALLESYTSAASLSTTAPSTLSTLVSNTQTTRTLPTTFISTSSTAVATSIAAAVLPSPPLTTSQKAGVAIAGTTGLLLAVVVAIYITRRHYTKKQRRSSTGSNYPKLAYIYDPRSEGSGREGGNDEALMSGGSSGMPLMDHRPRTPIGSPNLGHRNTAGSSLMRFSDPGNSFQDNEDPFRDSNDFSVAIPTNTNGAHSAAIKGYTAAPQRSPSTTDFPAMQASRDVIWPAPLLSPPISEARMGSRSSILSEIASMAYNPNVYSNASALRYERSSPYSPHQNHSLPTLQETTYTDSLRDPFEHDLPLQVDFGTETSDSVTVYAPPDASNLLARTTPALEIHPSNPWASSMLAPSSTQPPAIPLSRLVEQSPISPDATIVASERFSLMYDNDAAATYIAPSPQHADGTKSPISPPSRPANRGWEDIKRWSADKIVPSPVALSPPLRHWSPPPSKKKSLSQLRRKEGILFNSPEAARSIDRLSLKVKVAFPNHKHSNSENLRLSQFAKLDMRHRNDDSIRSPDSTFHHSVHSLSTIIQKKKSGDLEFACAGV